MSKNNKNTKLIRPDPEAGFLQSLAGIFFVGITAAYPLYLSAAKYGSMTKDKKDLFCVCTIIVAAVILMVLFYLLSKKGRFYARGYSDGESVRYLSVAEWAIVAFIIWALVSTLVSAYPGPYAPPEYVPSNPEANIWGGYRHEGFIPLLCYVLTFFIISRFYVPRKWHFLAFAGGSAVLSSIGILQFFGADIFNLFPFTYSKYLGEDGQPLYGHISAFFRTTLGNLNIVAAYCSIAVVLFAALFAVKSHKSKWSYLYLAASVLSFFLILIASDSAEGGKLGIAVSMALMIPYWLSERERLGRLFIVFSWWSFAYMMYNLYLSFMKNRIDKVIAPLDRAFLESFNPRNILLLAIATVVLLGIGLSLIFLLKKWAEKPMRIGGVALLAVIIVGGLLSVEVIGRRYADNPDNIIWQAREFMHGNIEDDFGSARGWIWKNGVSVIPDNPVFGTGPDTFIYALGQEAQSEAVAKYGVVFDKAHNTFLQIAVCMGIPALLAYLVFLIGLFLPAVKKAFERPVLLAFMAAGLSYAVQSFFCVEVAIVSPIFWVILGVISGEVWRYGKSDDLSDI